MPLTPIDETQLASAYSSGQYPKVVEHIIDYLGKFNEYSAAYLDEQSMVSLDHTVEAIVYYLSRPSFNLNREMFGRILGLHTQLTHMVAVSSYGNTENICQSYFRKNSPNIPLMLLAINRNPNPPPREKFFDLDARLATVWYGQYFVATRSFTSKHVHENLRQHMEFWDKRMPLVPTLTSGYMRCTYVDPTLDKKWRVRFNALVKEAFKSLVIKNTPNKKKMALVTGRWSPVNPTYKNRYPLVKALAQKYEIDLIHCGEERNDLDTSLFAAVKPATFKAGSLNLQAFYENDYGLVYYPDIGMNVESRLMSNIRLAPVQVMSNSHPVSTFGSEIDYFLTGKDSESAQSPQRYYSERLVLVPGIGTQPELSGFAVPPDPDSAVEPTWVGCPWGSLKINSALVDRLRVINQRLEGKVHYKFFVTIDAKSASVPLLWKELVEILGKDKFTLYANLPYPDYIKLLRKCNFALDAWPFGGNTSVIDCMFSQVPIVTQKGWQFYNMAGPVILERFGLHELVTRNENDYIETALRLFTAQKSIRKLREKMASLDVAAGISSLTSTEKYVEAFDYMMEHPRNMKITKPLEFV